MDPIAAQFFQQRYVFLPSVLSASHATLLYKYALTLAQRGAWQGDTQVPNTPAAYADPHMEELLLLLLPHIEKASAVSLYPTYSYLRVYKRGDVLTRHVDRPACEISVSLNLGYAAATPWPLWVEGPLGASAVAMEPGDGVLYRGTECFHWREAFAGEHTAQVFLHYVEQHGAHAAWKFDKRPSLGVARPWLPIA